MMFLAETTWPDVGFLAVTCAFLGFVFWLMSKEKDDDNQD